MKVFNLLCLLILLQTLSGNNLKAVPLAAPETYLYKLSKSLMGTPPSQNDQQQLTKALQAGTQEAFFKQKTQEYLSDKRFSAKLKNKFDELVRVSTLPLNYNSNGVALQSTAYDSVVGKVIWQNLSWNQLLLEKTYEFYTNPELSNFQFSEAMIYKNVLEGTQATSSFEEALFSYSRSEGRPFIEISKFAFNPQDPRIAGVLTTKRFLERYGNTSLNKNRRRAAAVFRIFLCDSMLASVPVTTPESENKDYEILLPAKSPSDLSEHGTEEQLRLAAADVHGQQKDCMACHYKLDPLGKTFGFSAAGLSPFPSKGGLNFTGTDQRMVQIPVQGISELAESIVQQPEYLNCQVSHFWSWYIGKDVPLSGLRRKELTQKFEQVGRRPKDFIAHLVTTDEFRARPVVLDEMQILARRASRIFVNCNNCHAHQTEDPDVQAWDLASFPYPAKDKDYMIRKISKTLDIKGNGAKRTMPPEDSIWKLNDDDYQTLKNWLEKGAPDFAGKPQVGP